MIVTVLVENTTVDSGLGCEHGLSLHIETGGRQVLFDMGQSPLFAENARALGVDLARVDLAVISHGHYDHGGGLATFLKRNDRAPVFLSDYAFEPHYNAAGKDIGLDPSLKEEKRLRPGQGVRQLLPGITLYDHCPRPYGVDSAGLTMGADRGLEDFRHEQYLLVEEGGRRILFSGCSHAGIRNIQAYFHPDVLVGGFHFSKRPLDESLEADGAWLAQFPTAFYTGHCTGEAQLRFLQSQMPELTAIRTGNRLEI